MSINSVGQYVANHKAWDHAGNVIPSVEKSEGIRITGKVAPWLPVQFYDKASEAYVVIMPGKALAFDNAGYLVPAGLGLSGAAISYTATDVSEGTIDVTTGVAVTGTKSVTLSEVITYMGGTATLAISKPVGVSSYVYFQWGGDASAYDDGTNPAAYRQHNFNPQQRQAITLDYVLEVPLVPAKTSSGDLTFSSYASNVATFSAVDNLPVATNTVRTPIVFADSSLTGASTHFVNQVSTASAVTALGDWHIDYTTGVVKCYYAADPTSGKFLVTYSDYASAPTGSNVSKFACALGDLVPGDFVKCNVDSNFVKATPLPVYGTVLDTEEADLTWNYDDFSVILGQVVQVTTGPTNLLDRVQSFPTSTLNTSGAGAYPGTAGQLDQMPGTATGGADVKVHYAGAADKMVAINLISR